MSNSLGGEGDGEIYETGIGKDDYISKMDIDFLEQELCSKYGLETVNEPKDIRYYKNNNGSSLLRLRML